MQRRPGSIEARLERFVAETLIPAQYGERVALDIAAWEVPGEPVLFAEAVAQEEAFSPFVVGSPWGRPWSTVWFRLSGEVPAAWREAGSVVELVVDLGFAPGASGFQCEGLLYDRSGTILKGIQPANRAFRLAPDTVHVDLLLEAAANPDIARDGDFSPTPDGSPQTAGDALRYVLRQVDIAVFNEEVWELTQDVLVLDGMAAELPASSPRRAELLTALERALDAVDPDDVVGTAPEARAHLKAALASPASASAHRITAVGHAHIDSAWLWPVRETLRKCARTFSNVLALMDDDPDFVFACSSAQQFAWIKVAHPALFDRIREKVAEGRFVPVGGMWVESDTNMPGGEALARQFVAGHRFFKDEFGIEPREVWLPDSFGYSAALPQIARLAGAEFLLTQKPSWNDTNLIPHHTFLWEGIDGSRVFTHLPPVDTYNSTLAAADLARAERQFADKGLANSSLVPFGYGDGGGGPTREMMAAARRTASLEGSPTVRLGTPEAFFEEARREYADPPVWSGELYLELHRGTYTSQARTKRGNRRSEHLLREAELWAASAAVLRGEPYPYEELETAWQTVLLNQFHDILPGSSIAWVHEQAEQQYAELAVDLERIIGTALAALSDGDDRVRSHANASPFEVDGVLPLAVGQRRPASGITAREEAGGFVLQNDLVRVVVDARGLIVSMWDRRADREAVLSGHAANLLQLHRDMPAKWDAWDIERQYRNVVIDLVDVDRLALTEATDEAASVLVERTFGRSSVRQTLTLRAGSASVEIVTDLDWHERRKLLKLAIPLDVAADRSAAETQFGHVFRATHTNTAWDEARFEICAHRWLHVGEPGFGVAIANDSSYGHDVTRTVPFPAGLPGTTVRVSLVRAPEYPDPNADQGRHTFGVSVTLGVGIADAVREGYRMNLPLREVAGRITAPALVKTTAPGVVVESVKLAEDRSGDLIVRLYESLGERATTQVALAVPCARVVETNLHEAPVDRPRALIDATTTVTDVALRPFQIVTLRFVRPADPAAPGPPRS